MKKWRASNIKNTRNQSLIKILYLLLITLSTGLLKGKDKWQAKGRIEYLTLMLIYSIIDRNKESISQKIILGQRKKEMPNALYDRATEIGKSIGWNKDKLGK